MLKQMCEFLIFLMQKITVSNVEDKFRWQRSQFRQQLINTIIVNIIQMSNSQTNIALLEAEGQLNRQIQSALHEFRQKILSNVSAIKKQNASKPYESYKEGPQKVFLFRESLLSIMFQINDFRTIYNMMMASFIILTFSLFHDSYMHKGELLDRISFLNFFSGAKTVFIAWIALVFVFFTIIFVTKIAINHSWFVWLPIYVGHISLIVTVATQFSQTEGLGFASVIIIMTEAIRMIMKAHSYLRTKLLYLKDNEYKHFQFRGVKVIHVVSNNKNNQANLNEQGKLFKINIKNEDIFTEIKKISYFLFAPTLIYRDQYTLTPVRSVRKIIVHAINFLSCIYYAFMLYQSWCKPVIQELENSLNVKTLSSAIINLMLPSVMFLIIGFFGFLHSWLNLWSEITRFPDRAFYADWWNSCQFGSYYRKWNIVVHDWLYYYIYLDFNRFFPSLRKIRVVPQLATFMISAIIHEFIIYYAIGFFYPILFILFAGPGILFIQASVKKTSVNLIFWIEMYIGISIMFTLYLTQVFAREKIPNQLIDEKWGVMGFLIPRTLYLGQQ